MSISMKKYEGYGFTGLYTIYLKIVYEKGKLEMLLSILYSASMH